MCRAALLAAVVIIVAALLAASPATAVLCSDLPLINDFTLLVNYVAMCESMTGEMINQSMTPAQRKSVCTQCTLLADMAAAKLFPNCNVTDDDGVVTTASAYYGSLFACSSSSATVGPAGTRVSSSPSPSYGSSGNSSVSDSTSRHQDSDAPTVDATGDNSSTVLALAIVGGAVLVLVVAVVVGRGLLKRSRAKWVEVMLSPSPHARLSLTAATGTAGASEPSAGRGADHHHQQENSQRGPWDDKAIIAARVPKDKVLFETLLSRGGFGEVYRGTYNGQVVAIKMLLPATRKNLVHIESFFAEVKLMATLEHAHIVAFIGVAWDALSDVCVLSEFMEGGDLRTLLTRFEQQEHRPHGFDADKLKIALYVVHALTYLHSLRPVVLHRDLKSKNILLDRELNAKLMDFGVSRERSDTMTMTAGVGTSLWMAPEVMLGERYDEKSDMFSFGIVLSELDSHLLPYANAKAQALSDSGHRLPDTAILQMVSLGRLSVEFSPHADPKIVALARACVSVDPLKRPTAADALHKLHTALRAA